MFRVVRSGGVVRSLLHNMVSVGTPRKNIKRNKGIILWNSNKQYVNQRNQKIA